MYCSASINLAGGVAANALQAWLPELFRSGLARPLDIQRYYYNLMPDGQGYGGGGLYLRPRDRLKFGQLFLDGGVWNRRRIVSKRWVDESVREHATYSGHGYGLGWHLREVVSGGRTYCTFSAEGNGGQVVSDRRAGARSGRAVQRWKLRRVSGVDQGGDRASAAIRAARGERAVARTASPPEDLVSLATLLAGAAVVVARRGSLTAQLSLGQDLSSFRANVLYPAPVDPP